MTLQGCSDHPAARHHLLGCRTTNSAAQRRGTPERSVRRHLRYPTVDVDSSTKGSRDFPLGAVLSQPPFNALAATTTARNVVKRPLRDAVFQGKVGDTSYYMFPTTRLR